MMLMNEMRNLIKKENIADEKVYTPIYSTGFDVLDYKNGKITDGEIEIGVDGGKIITVLGKSGTGKTTLALQIAKNIVEPFEYGQIFHMDYERATTKARVQSLFNWSNEEIETKYLLLNSELYSESLYGLAKGIMKTKLREDIYNDIKIKVEEKKDYFGNDVYTLPPTVIIVDSWALLVPKEIADESELSGSMSASSIAKTNNAIVKRLTGVLEKANIILLIINHITKKIEIGFTKTQADINYLKQDESMPGGSSAIYLANNIIKITTSTKLEEDEKFGIRGFMTIVEYLKSRSNEAGRKFEMVFSQSDGFSNELSNLNILLNNKILKGSPRAYFIDGCEDVKFTLKTFMEKYNENPKLKKAFDKITNDVMVSYIPKALELQEKYNKYDEYEPEDVEDVEDITDEEIELIKCVDENKDIWLGSDGNYYDGETGEPVKYKASKKK